MSKKKDKAPWQDFITGTFAGACDVLVTHPLWTIKTLTQNHLSTPQIVKLVKNNPLILYNGVTANTLTMIPLTTTRVFLSSVFEKNFETDNPFCQLLLSCSAGSVSSIFGSPTELARTIKLKSAVFMSDQRPLLHSFSNTFHIVKDVYCAEGIVKIFTGYPAIAVRDGIYTAAFFTGAPMVRDHMDPYFNNYIAKTLASFSLASIFASFINHPFDTIKTVQHSLFAENWQLGSTHKCDFNEACKKIYEKDGIHGFFSGYPARGVRFLVGLIVKASIIEIMDNFWTKYNSKNDSGSTSNGHYNLNEVIDNTNTYSADENLTKMMGDIEII